MPELSGSTYSETDASNSSASPNGYPEGMPPSGLNDSARATVGALQRFWNRMNGRYASTGTTPNYVLTPTVALAAYVTGERYSFRANFTCGATPTLNISALGAKNIKKFVNGTTKANLAANDIMSGQAVTVEYDGTDMLMVTPTAGLIDASTTATTSASGIIELATQAEVDTGTDAVRAVTPSTLTGWTPGVASVTFDPSADEALIRDASASNVLKRANINTLILGTPVASTSGTSIDFTGIPSWAKRIVINFSGVSTSGTNLLTLQLGDSGGFETTGYAGCVSQGATGGGHSGAFALDLSHTAAFVLEGSVTLTLMNSSTNLWAMTGLISRSDTSAVVFVSSGTKATSAALDRVRVTTVGSTDTFDAGSINILYD